MATSDIRWKKLPVGIIRDEDLDYIADQIAPELRAAPYMFYMTALCKSDNDGIFDLEDGVIFSRLMRIGTPQDVFTIANLMIKRRIILRAGETTRCMIANWEYPEKVAPRTLDDRRAIVAKQIEMEKRNAQIAEFTVHDDAPIAVSFNNNAASNNDFFCGLNDKNAENVTKNIFDDKNEKNVVEKIETEREIERKIDRNTQERIDKIDKTQELQLPTGLRSCQSIQTIQNSKSSQKAEPEKDQWEDPQQPAKAGMEQSGSMGKGNHDEKEQAVMNIVQGFFAKNCLGFDVMHNYEALLSITDRMIWLSDNRNPPEIVASVFLGQFKKLVEEDGYYKGAPLSPMQLIKPGTYEHVLNMTSKILLNKSNNQRWQEQEQALRAEIEKEKAVGDSLDNEYLRYNIDPQDPNRSQKLLLAKAGEKKENEPP